MGTYFKFIKPLLNKLSCYFRHDYYPTAYQDWERKKINFKCRVCGEACEEWPPETNKRRKSFLSLIIFTVFSFISASDTLTVGIDPFPPCVIIDSNKVTGFDIELFETIADSIGLKYQYKQVPEFKQMFGLLQNKTYDVGISGITINEEREEVIDFSHPYLKSGLCILINNEKNNNVFYIISAYLKKAWKALFYLIIFLFICGVLIWAVERGKTSFSSKFFSGVGDGMYWTNTTMTTVGYGDKAPQTPVGKILAMAVQWIGIAFVFPYIVAQMTVTIQEASYRIKCKEDLLGKKVATVSGTTSIQASQKYGATVVEQKNIEDCIALLKRDKVDAIVFDMPTLMDAVKKDNTLTLTGGLFEPQDYGIAFTQESPLREKFNRELLRTMSSGKYQELYSKWFKE